MTANGCEQLAGASITLADTLGEFVSAQFECRVALAARNLGGGEG
jgi:hypothetical protein